MENLAIEIKFAQKLAGNETKTRLKALKKLKKYLRAKSASIKDGFSEEDMLKLWKGLHYCMWMQDKPLLQEELSTTLTQLVHDMSTVDAQMLFIKVFFITEAREWNSIDIWRLDKFMMMVRNMMYESLVVVKKLHWDSKHLDKLTQIFSDQVMNPDSDSIPDGLKIHFGDIYLDEVERAGEGHLTGPLLLKLLVPFIKFLQKGKNMTLLKRVRDRVFDPVITRLADEVKMRHKEAGDGEESKQNDDVPYLSLKFDGELVSDYLFQASQEDCVLGRNRPMLYDIVTKLKNLQQGVLPQKKEMPMPEGITHTDIQKAVNNLINLDKNKNRKKKNKKKSKQGNQLNGSGVNENTDPNNNSAPDTGPDSGEVPSTSHVGEKRKHAVTEDDESLTKIKKKKLESDATVTGKTEKKTLKKLMNKFSKLDVKKGKKDKKVHSDVAGKAPVPQTKKTLKSESKKRPVTGNAEPEEKIDVIESAKNENTENAQVFTVSAVVPQSMKKNVESTTPEVPKKKGKRTHLQTKSDESSPEKTAVDALVEQVPEIAIKGPSPAVKSAENSSELQDGEIEIFIPNKKFKGNKNISPKSDFAAFEHSKPPAAFVKRSLSKSLKKTPSALKTPGSAKTPGSNKRVCFDMKKNQAQVKKIKEDIVFGEVQLTANMSSISAFKESLNSPLTPFNPTKKPESGILKSPAPSSIPATASQGQGSGMSTRSARGSNSSIQTPVTRQATQKIVAKKVSHVATPVVSLGFERKKATPARRKHAADFFL